MTTGNVNARELILGIEFERTNWGRFFPLAGVVADAFWAAGYLLMQSVRPEVGSTAQEILAVYQEHGIRSRPRRPKPITTSEMSGSSVPRGRLRSCWSRPASSPCAAACCPAGWAGRA